MMRRWAYATALLTAGLVFVLQTGCAGLPVSGERPASQAYTDTGSSSLGRALAPLAARHPGRTGVHPLANPLDAFAARMLLAHAAERSLDVQYYIWRADATGELLFDALWSAAERGVRVRLLLDDMNSGGLDGALSALDAHPRIEVRLVNPFAHRNARLFDFAADFDRVNRRMHNKAFIADNQAAIVGGRNIGDEYFGADLGMSFADLDVLAGGAAVPAISASFDGYWNSAVAYPVTSLLRPLPPEQLHQVRAAWSRHADDPQAAAYLRSLRETTLVRELLAGQSQLEWVPARLVSDAPAKLMPAAAQQDETMLQHLEAALGSPQKSLDIVSPYFVPTEAGTAALRALAERGVQVRVLTNSLAATDVAAVHAGYARYRKALLEGGVRLYELKATPAAAGAEKPDSRIGSSSAGSLHAKTYAVDRQRIFVGSLNLDPRSVRLNTEMGLVLESAALAGQLSAALDEGAVRNAYEVRLAADGSLQWLDASTVPPTPLATEPGAGWWRRLGVSFMSLLPIEWML